MSEQKMPALPERDFDGPDGVAGYYASSVRQAIREAIEYGRQQERERLEPLRGALEAADGVALSCDHRLLLNAAVFSTARTLLEQTE